MRLATFAMGTRFELVLVGDDPVRLRAAGEAALAEIDGCDRRLSRFARSSLLSHVNRCAATTPVRLDEDTYRLFEVCGETHAASRGAFDPSVAPLMDVLGVLGERDTTAGERRAGCGGEALRAAHARVGWQDVRLDARRRTIAFARPGLSLDLGGIAKGHALDLAARVLREAGVGCALLHGGTSSVIALGPPPGAEAWRVALGDGPHAPEAHLCHGALAVSAPTGRVLHGAHGEPLGHVLDPRTGRDARGLRLAAVLAPDATLADAWSTALLVAGRTLSVPDEISVLLGGAEAEAEAETWHHVPAARGSACRFVVTARGLLESA